MGDCLLFIFCLGGILFFLHLVFCFGAVVFCLQWKVVFFSSRETNYKPTAAMCVGVERKKKVGKVRLTEYERRRRKASVFIFYLGVLFSSVWCYVWGGCFSSVVKSFFFLLHNELLCLLALCVVGVERNKKKRVLTRL